MFDNGMPFGWTMEVQGSRQRVLDSVLPHEVTHAIFATHFGRPLPRWADEGACTTVEHPDEKARQDRFLVEFLTTDRGIPFNKMFAMKEYPPDMLPLYSQGYSLARYLIQQGGKQKFIQYVGEGMKTNNWPAATRKHYGFRDLSDLQVTWLAWVAQGSPDLADARSAVAMNDAPAAGATPATLTSVSNPATNAKVLGSQSMAHGYAQPERPSSLGSDAQPNDTRSNSASRPYSEGWYSKQRDQSGPSVLPASHRETPRDGATLSPPANRGALCEPGACEPSNDNFLAAVSPSLGRSADAASNPRQVLLEWSRPSDKPWATGEVASQTEFPPATPIHAMTARPATIPGG
jgi:hypothetical protein